jgi:hypothetical protein
MKYSVNDKESGENRVFKSISEIARTLNVSYAVAYKNLKYSLNHDLPKGIKLSQKTFDAKYEIRVAD